MPIRPYVQPGSFADLLFGHLARLKIGPTDFTARLRRPKGTVSRWLNGKKTPRDIETFVAISRVLVLSEAELDELIEAALLAHTPEWIAVQYQQMQEALREYGAS